MQVNICFSPFSHPTQQTQVEWCPMKYQAHDHTCESIWPPKSLHKFNLLLLESMFGQSFIVQVERHSNIYFNYAVSLEKNWIITKVTTPPAAFNASTACLWVTFTVDTPFTATIQSPTLHIINKIYYSYWTLLIFWTVAVNCNSTRMDDRHENQLRLMWVSLLYIL